MPELMDRSENEPRSEDRPAQEGERPFNIPTSVAVVAMIAFFIAVRAAVGLHPYSVCDAVLYDSGEHTPPMYGDYEAQRHWMEITIGTPALDWYRNTTSNDLSYWGLDYPPLSGYASWVFGKAIEAIEPEAVALHTSRGYESALSRALMRATVILSDSVFFFPALILLSYLLYSQQRSRRLETERFYSNIAFGATLPALILVDHGHFQYNGVSLGLFLFSVACFCNEREALGALLFCCSVYFKQMGLYYGVAIFAYLVARMVHLFRTQGAGHGAIFALKIMLSITLTTMLVFWPCVQNHNQIQDILHRLFPLSRGLYEDKVANIWCSISVLIKINKMLNRETLFMVCFAVTVFMSLPFCIAVAKMPSDVRLLMATGGCSLAAYLFSYQVHEKQILIPLVPLAMLYGRYPFLATWTSMAATFSLYPLLFREGLSLAYFAAIGIHVGVLLVSWDHEGQLLDKPLVRYGSGILIAIGVCLNCLVAFSKAPRCAPDLYVLFNTSYACLHFCGIYSLLVFYMFTDHSNCIKPEGAPVKPKTE